LSLLLRASDPFQSRFGIGQLFLLLGETSEGMIHYFGGFVQSDEVAGKRHGAVPAGGKKRAR
jgi:hypothetical protein